MQSATIGKLVEATSKAQGEMRVATKSSVNPFFKSNYSDNATCVETAREVLAKYGLAVFQSTEDYVGQGQKAEMIFWVLKTTLAHISGEFIDSIFPLTPKNSNPPPTEKNPIPQPPYYSPQAIGSCVSYARRYTFQAIINQVSGNEDDDGIAASGLKHNQSHSAYSQAVPCESMQASNALGSSLRGNSPNVSNATYRATDSSKTTFAATEYQILRIGELSKQLGWDIPTSQKWLVIITNKSTRASLTEEEANWCIEDLLRQKKLTQETKATFVDNIVLQMPPKDFTNTNSNLVEQPK